MSQREAMEGRRYDQRQPDAGLKEVVIRRSRFATGKCKKEERREEVEGHCCLGIPLSHGPGQQRHAASNGCDNESVSEIFVTEIIDDYWQRQFQSVATNGHGPNPAANRYLQEGIHQDHWADYTGHKADGVFVTPVP